MVTSTPYIKPPSPPPPPGQPPVSPRVLPEERPEQGMVSARAREILESMRQQRESFLASLKPSEAEAAARRSYQNKTASSKSSPTNAPSKPPLFTSKDAQALTKRLNDSINQRKERLARFSNDNQQQQRSPSEPSSRKIMTQSPRSLATASTAAESCSIYSSPTNSSGYDSDGSPAQFAQIELPLARHPNLEGILENSIETESETGSENSPLVKKTTSCDTSLLSEAVDKDERSVDWDEDFDSSRIEGDRLIGLHGEDDSDDSTEENEVQVHIALSDSDGETESSKPVGAPMMTLFGYTAFDESVTRPPLLVHCSSHSSSHLDSGVGSDESLRHRVSRSNSVVSGLSTFSGPAMGPLGHTVEQRKKALLRTLSTTVAELEKMKVDIPSELSSVASQSSTSSANDDNVRPLRRVQTTGSSSYTSAGISSVSSYSLTTNGSDTSGWVSHDENSRSSSFVKKTQPPKESETSKIERKGNRSSDPAPSPLSSTSADNPLGDMKDDASDAEPKLLCSPPTPQRKEQKPRKVSPNNTSQKKKASAKLRTPSRKSLGPVGKKSSRPGPRELAAICFPRGNLWNISKSSGLSFRGPIRVNRKSVYRSPDFIRFSSEYRCGARGGLMDLASHSGMPKTQISPLRKIQTTRVNGRQRWKLKARGGHYHVAVWTNMTRNMLSPASIFRDLKPQHHEPVSSREEEMVRIRARNARLKVGALGSFHFIANETRKECI